MAHDELLAIRISAALGARAGLEEKKMFGGVGFLVNGNMACGVHKNNLIVRVGPEKHAWALAQPHTRPFDMTGRPMSGWVEVEPPGCASESALKSWVDLGLAFALSLPGK
jgi:TfoX/Sxy family transcriptional regulator of competence genes